MGGKRHIAKPERFWAIDVKRKCVCALPPASRYITLNYCWTRGETLKLIKANAVGLLRTGSLEKVMQELPRTIQDAIEFVFDFGEAYLWVDALCILQDCNDEKQFQLSQMDRVYGSA
ncbi:uncharacterized protein A1O5_07031 [Cladophialophora psammophila CBS 110553]|uniref:Heterokaryon incompatibility domain-containing protein n=1 Tax=Cladophialophora psammophila CBS 110553 TaxID=1182543 RepID=W9WPX9_9EURO|nr:uncharacterized protein A1O5_07031 [Cladophialophora psammophila CBS 110553]EXJ69958.1 hypothetical protein A1O5_07031 [Cladophialophora psammophila CBS 110553]